MQKFVEVPSSTEIKAEIGSLNSTMDEVAYLYNPTDYKVLVNPSHIVFHDPFNIEFISTEKGCKNMQLTRRAFSQIVRNLHPRASSTVALDLYQTDHSLGLSYLNGLIRNSSRTKQFKNIQLRTRKLNNIVIAGLSEGYPPVTNSSVIDIVKEALKSYSQRWHIETDFLRIYADWETISARLPLFKIGNHGKGIYAGINVVNGQVGNKPLTLNAMIWEMICTNGLMMVTGNFVFMNRRHSKHMLEGMDKFSSWLESIMLLFSEEYEKLTKKEIPYYEKFIKETLPKENPQFITGDLAQTILRNLNETDNKVVTAWDVVRSITQVSQKFNIEKRSELDSFAYNLAVKEGWLN